MQMRYMMRAKTGSKFIIAFSLVFLLAIFLFSFVLSVDLASASPSVNYISAEVTTSAGDFLPAGMVYDKTAVDLSFAVYTSEDRSAWTKDDTLASKFELKYYTALGVALLAAPAEVGSYRVDVVAKDSTLAEYFNDSLHSIVKDVVVGSATFTIYNQNLFLYNTLLDADAANGSAISGVSNLLLADDGSSDFYSQVVGGTSLYLGGSVIPSSDYTLGVQYKNAGVFSDTSTINKVGTYRLKLRIDSSVDLSCTVAPDSLTKEVDDYLFYREFTVTCETLSFSLAAFSPYEGVSRDVTLSAESAAKLTSLAGANYQTQLLYRSSDGIGRVLAADSLNSDLYHPTEVGDYVYRVVFLTDVDVYGVKTGDYVDVSFSIQPIPYVVRYYLPDDTEIDYQFNYNGNVDLEITPVFYDLDGHELASVYNTSQGLKYSVAYQYYNGAIWLDNATVRAAGRYKVVITFNESATAGSYPSPSPIKKEFQIVSGTLEVKTTSNNYYYNNGAEAIPSFSFTSAAGDESANVGAYTVTYYQEDGTLIGSTAPTAVGTYIYELRITNAIDRLNVPAGATYRDSYSIVYRPVEVIVGDDVFFRDAITQNELLSVADGPDPDFEIVYYVKSGNICKRLAAAPTEEGQYVMQVVALKALPLHNVAVGDVFSGSFSITATSALIGINSSMLDLTYDGGVKVPEVSFSHDMETLPLSKLSDYQTAYYRLEGNTYVPCGAPVLAGSYRFVVTFLKSDPANGMACGAYGRVPLVVAPAQYNVTFTISDASKDLVYDAQAKTYDVAFTYKTRPVELASSVKYAVSGEAFGDSTFTNVGSYQAKVVLDDDKSGSLALVGGTIDFAIVKLSLKATFVVPLGYNRMWSGSVVSPAVEYLCLNGRYTNQVLEGSFGIDLNETVKYYYSDDGIHYNDERDPIMPGDYREDVSLGNANVILSQAASEGDNGDVVSSPLLEAGVAGQTFKVTPREISVGFDYDYAKDALYFTGSENGDRKGVSQVRFMAYQDQATGYSNNVSALFAGDYKIYYFTSDYQGTVSGEGSETKPYEKSYYVARVMMEPDGTDDDYLAKYTFKNGKDRDGVLGETALSALCYVDDVFRIKDQNKLKILYEMPSTFAENNEFKTISVRFENNFSDVALEEGDGHDYKITYLDEADNENTTSFKTKGQYRVRITFLKDIIAYRLEDYSGEYTSLSEYYIANGDVLEYGFEIFEQRVMNVAFTAPASLYYDAEAKAYAAKFFVSDNWTDCAVTLTYDTHYRLRYYKKTGTTFALIDAAPTVPGDYAVEVIFLKDLLDYTYSGKTVLKDGFYAISETAAGEKVATPRLEFTIQKAILVVGGVSAQDKSFDGTNTATFSANRKTISIKQVDDAPCGANVHNLKASDLTGTLAGEFASIFPEEDIVVTLTESGKYAIPAAYADYYELEYPAFSAKIEKAKISVLLRDGESAHEGTTILVTREYNPYSIESAIAFRLSYDEDLIDLLFPTLDKTAITVGELSHEKGVSGGNSVGDYPIVLNTLALNDAATGAVYSGHPISDLFYLALEKDCYYRIIARPITVSVEADQSKIYGDDDPNEFIVLLTAGRLIYGDTLSYQATRASGENAGRYLISLSNVKVLDKKGEDVSANYDITKVTSYFTINRRELKISPKDQQATYLEGFSHVENAYILDMTRKNTNGVYGVDVTDRFLNDPPVGGDRLSGKLSYATTAEEDNALKFRITQGTMTAVVNAMGKNVSANYVITFDETPKYYTITKIDINVKLKENAVLQKYYGDKEPIIDFTIDTAESKKLGNLTLSVSSSVGRAPGETVGQYHLYADNSARSFSVYDDGIDVTDFFSFSVRQKVDSTWRVISGDTVFTILPRPIVVTVEDASYENTGREVEPVLKCLNANGSRLSNTLREDLESKVTINVPKVEYHDGENLVTPEIVGEGNPNYEITLQAGKITVVYLQNVITVTPVEENDEVYKGRKFMLSGIMLYKTLRFYKLETANGEQPTHKLDIELPIDENLAGDGLVVVALRQDGGSKAFSFLQSGMTVVYADDGAYYVAIAEVQEWFYVIWGVVIILVLVALYFLVRLIIFLIKKHKKNHPVKAKAEAKEEKKQAPKKKKVSSKRSGVVLHPTGAKAEEGKTDANAAPETDDSMFSDTAVTEAAPKAAVKSEPVLPDASTDDMFTDVAPVETAAPAPAPAPVAPAADDSALSNDMVTEAPVTDGKDAAPAQPVPEKEDAKDKKKKDKKDKKDKSKDENKPKGFTPTAFKPKGDRSAAYQPTRSFKEDLFNEEQSTDDGSSLLSDSAISDGAIVTPSKSSKPAGDDDELVISRSSGFSLDDSEEGDKNKDNDDMM